MPGRKTTQTELLKRVNVILNLVVSGLNRAEIMRYVANKTPWGVSERTIDSYLARARRVIAAVANVEQKRELGLSMLRLEELFKRSLAGRDYKAALAVQKERHELLGLKKQEHNVLGDIEIRVVHEPVRNQGKPGSVSIEYDETD